MKPGLESVFKEMEAFKVKEYFENKKTVTSFKKL